MRADKGVNQASKVLAWEKVLDEVSGANEEPLGTKRGRGTGLRARLNRINTKRRSQEHRRRREG